MSHPPSRIVHLNVGGVKYTTTSATLLQQGENYFTGLLSGKFPDLLDENGAYFIDRNGTYFGVVLEYLRSSEISIPKDISRKSVLTEARFYLIEGLIESLEQEESNELIEKHILKDDLRFDGFYADTTHRIAIAFLQNGQIVSTVGDNYYDSMIVFHQVWTIPSLWQQPELGRKYASFINRFVRRGRYWIEGCTLKLCFSAMVLTQDEDEAVLGVVARGGLDLYVMHTPPIFNKHQFTLWHGEERTNSPD
eukprot:Phypoly_transcript_11460.p1 GENE.Phypoly_transcript_11460~~Phypoly_transcript_11460.p1  ORF type:complete len:250 (+),score=50.89 Phypoly_transcript_11460:66-815(+)